MHALQKLAQRYPAKRILITGSTSGLGEAMALQFAGAGFRVAVASRNPGKVAATAARIKEVGGEPLEIILDVTREQDFHAAAGLVTEHWGGLDILVNNAGIITSGKLSAIGLDMWQQSFETDLWSVIHGCRILLPLLVDSGGGHLVNVASAAGLLGPPDLASYGVAKAGVISLSESLAVELVEEKIDVTVSCPTVFRSHLLDEEGHDSETMQGATFDGLQHEMETTSISSEDIAASLVEAMAKRRMYSVPQRDARVQWWLSRTFPESFRKLLVYLYRNKKWVFKTD